MNKVKEFLASLWRRITSNDKGGLDDDLSSIVEILDYALDAVEEIAKLTPTKVDDEIVGLARKFGIGVRTGITHVTDDEKKAVLHAAALRALQSILTRVGIVIPAARILSVAIDLAYLFWRAKEQKT